MAIGQRTWRTEHCIAILLPDDAGRLISVRVFFVLLLSNEHNNSSSSSSSSHLTFSPHHSSSTSFSWRGCLEPGIARTKEQCSSTRLWQESFLVDQILTAKSYFDSKKYGTELTCEMILLISTGSSVLLSVYLSAFLSTKTLFSLNTLKLG